MTADMLALLFRASLAANAAIILVLCLRRPLRRVFGAQAAYSFWLLVPVVVLAAFLPARTIAITTGSTTFIAPPPPAMTDSAWIVLAIWSAGVLASAIVLIRGHRRLHASLSRGNVDVGPIAIGIISPRIVLPADFEQRYSGPERTLVLAHEHEHIRAGDLQINALAALVQCANWFSPLIYLARSTLRIDQELACDERVMRRHHNDRTVYAQAMLKAQLACHPELGCAWPSFGATMMKQRISMLKRAPAGAGKRALAGALLALTVSGAGATAWAAQPPRIAPVSTAAELEPGDAVAEAGNALIDSVAALRNRAEFEAERTARGVQRLFGRVPGRDRARSERSAGQRAERELQRVLRD